MKHIVSFSGGIGSYMAAKRVIEQHGKENVLLVFTDTKIEDEDLYRFLDDAVKDLGAEFIKLEDGRTPWDVFFDEKYIGNTRHGNCTLALKTNVFRPWLEEKFSPDECVIYLGIDWSEEQRYTNAIKHWKPYTVKAPMCEAPYMTKPEMLEVLKLKGIEVPSLYKLGFSHNNCGGFCVKAGQGHYKKLLKEKPDLYKYHEEKELKWQKEIGKNNTILRDRRGGTTKPMTLKDFRERIESENEDLIKQLDFEDVGGCGCYPY